MTNEIKNVPELRFPEFKEEWVEKKLGEITSKISDGIHSTPTYDSNGDIYFINGNNLVNGRIDFKTSKKISVQEFNKYKNYLEAKNTLLLSINGTIGNIAKYEGENILLGKSAAYINVVSKFISRCYIFYYLQTSKIYESFLRELTGTTIKNLSLKSIKNIIVYISELDEQQKIGNFFSKLDRQIELEEQKLAKLEEQKKGYMQKIFSQELRFKDEKGNDYPEWETKKLDELGEFNSGVGFPEKYQRGSIGVPFFKVSDMNLQGNEKFMNTANNYVSIEQVKQKKWKVIQNVPAIIFAKVGAAIMLNRKRMILNPFLIDNNTMSYSFSNHWDKNFGYAVFQMLNLPKYAQVGALPSYNSKDIGIIQIRLPIKEEQEKIGNFFSELDEIINKQSHKIDALKLRKKGFLQKMFV